jgi:hypothetical protein
VLTFGTSDLGHESEINPKEVKPKIKTKQNSKKKNQGFFFKNKANLSKSYKFGLISKTRTREILYSG